MHRVGRYTLYAKIGSGGMATVHFARLEGGLGFTRTVAVKRLQQHLTTDAEFMTMFLDEARLAARIRHPNVVATLDVEQVDSELLVVMEYIAGEPLSRLIRFVAGQVEHIPFEIVSAIMTNVLSGLHAAHEIRDKDGTPIDLVHRDVSPQNILVGADGVTRVLDFGVAKARGRLHTTQDGKVKGKLAYMSPEQLRGDRVDRRTDIYAAGVVLWELLTLVRLFANKSQAVTLENVLQRPIEPPSAYAADVPPGLDAVVMRALSRDPAGRFETAKQMASAIEEAVPAASQAKVGAWVEGIAREALDERAAILADIERAAMKPEPIEPIAQPEVGSVEPATIAMAPSFPRTRRRSWGVVVAALAVGLVIAGVVYFTRDRNSPMPAKIATPPITVPPPTPRTTIAVATSPPEPIIIIPPQTTTQRVAPRPASHCDPPYTTGADGIRRYKVDCLQ